MILYGINLVPLKEELRGTDTTLLSPFYSNDVAFDGSTQRSAVQLRMLMDRGADRGYFPDPSKSIFIAENPEEKE